jgi:TldD protein
MRLSRRAVLAGMAAASAVEAKGLVIEGQGEAVISAGLDAAKAAGASYADVRLHRRRNESLHVRDGYVDDLSDDETYGLAVRVLCNGAWGFAASPTVSPEGAKVLARRACELAKANAAILTQAVVLAPQGRVDGAWQTPLMQDPFRLPISTKVELLQDVCERLKKVPGVSIANAGLTTRLEWKLLGTSEGSRIEQRITRLGPSYGATAIDRQSGEFASRRWDGQARQAGWEWIDESHFLADAERVGSDAVEKLKSPSVTPGVKTVVLHPSNLWLTIHESVGHPTELDRAMGLEANFAGTSFATLDKLRNYTYAAPFITLYADRTTPGGLATCGFDDEGVPTQKWNLVEAGKFVGYQTTREQAGWVGEKASRGCSYAQDYASVAFQRMPNVSLAPAKQDLGVSELIEATDEGLLVVGTGSWSIDQQRYNFQFSGQMFYELKKGKIVRAVRDVAYQSNTPEFWNSCDLLGGAKDWQLGAAFDDGKGEPMQSNPVSHGCPPARFKKVNVLNTRSQS